jgi:glucose/arabinose dehydrogenase
MRKLSCFVLLAIFGALFNLTISAQSSITLQPFLSGLSSPVFMTNAGDGTNRVFVVEKGGVIKVVQPGSTVPTVFLDISSRVSTSGERGLLGLAFHPDYENNRRFFVYFTRASDGDIQIAEYQASAANSNVADTAESVIITIEHSSADNHNGGTIAFGTDGFLYAGTGDGGGGNDPGNNAQNINSLLGKFIRLDINSGSPYSIPGDNPFAGMTAGADEIYAVGMRNPYRFSFDRGGGALYAGDVGQGAIEEVDIITRGGNYGWRVYEGTQCTNLDPMLCNPANFVAPIFQYSSADMSGRCSITGGYVYRGTRGTLASGTYIYGDFCTGEILTGASQNVLLGTGRRIVSFGEDEAGELYVVGFGGTVEKIVPLGATAATVTVGGRVTTAAGRGIGNILVRMTDSLGNVRAATTTSFGYYSFADVVAGETYIITAKGKRYIFEQYLQVININADTDAVNFITSK